MRYLIDGYNWFFSSDLFNGRHFLKEYSAFLAKAKTLLATLNNKSILIFDGHPHKEMPKGPSLGITIIYTGKDQSADAYILETLRFRKSGPFTLISSDIDLARSAKMLGAKTCSPFRFERMLHKKQPQLERPHDDPVINEYYIKIFSERLNDLEENLSE